MQMKPGIFRKKLIKVEFQDFFENTSPNFVMLSCQNDVKYVCMYMVYVFMYV